MLLTTGLAPEADGGRRHEGDAARVQAADQPREPNNNANSNTNHYYTTTTTNNNNNKRATGCR